MKRKCKSRALALLICAIMVPAAFSCSQKEEPQSGAEENKTAIRLPDMTFIYEKYYPEIDEGALFVPEPEP